MRLLKKMSEKLNNKASQTTSEDTLYRVFLDLQGSPEFPFTLALNSFEQLQQQSSSTEELSQHLLEDILISSLYATFYEEIFHTIHENQDVAVPLVNRFSEDQQSREQIIAEQAESHLQFILNRGTCAGCRHCDHHQDVADLVGYWEGRDFKFFVTLFMGMQTIQYTMEYLLYDVIPTCQDYSDHVSRLNILKLRQTLYDFVEKKLEID